MMFGQEMKLKTDTLAKIEEMETRMLTSIQNGELFADDAEACRQDGNFQGQMNNITAQQTCMITANAYANAVLVLRKKMESGELD